MEKEIREQGLDAVGARSMERDRPPVCRFEMKAQGQ